MGAEKKGLRVLTVGGFMLAGLGVCAAEEVKQEQAVDKKPAKKEVVTGALAPTTIMANRTETDLSKVGSSVTVLNVKQLDKEGVRHMDEALKFVPGVVSESTQGQRGTNSSIFIRGTETDHTYLIVDGMRVSDSNISLGGFLGASNLNGFSRVEILRGPQGALYGGNAIGGVVGLYSAKGEGDFSGTARVEGGSFNSWNTILGIQGAEGDFSYSLSLGYERTDNDLPNNEFEQFSYALRLDYAVNSDLDIGMTIRGSNGELDRPFYDVGKTFEFNAHDETDLWLTTFYADYRVNECWTSKLTLGVYDQKNIADTVGYSGAWGPVSPNLYTTDVQKSALYWDNSYSWNDRNATQFGLVYEQTDFENSSVNTPDPWGGNYALNETRDQYGLYVNHVLDVTEQWNVSGGLRWEDYDDYGDEVTWRAASSYTVKSTKTEFRGSIGKGFRAPSFNDLYGYNGLNPNPDLKAETALGWDFGIAQPFCDGQYKVGITYFATRIEDAIDYDSTFKSVNIDGVSETSGIEASLEGDFLNDRLHATLAYTWLDRSIGDKQPENTFGLRVSGDVTDSLKTGFSVTSIDSRNWGADDLDGYVLLNLFANYQLIDNVMFDVRVENALDVDYDYYSGWGSLYPGRGAGVFGGVTFTF